jgi:SAM-dependent methyltransferase
MNTLDPELSHWAEAAPNWARNADRIEQITAEATSALLTRLNATAGQRLLDVAAGPGDPSLRLAELVGPSGHVLATDGVAEMLETLERRALERKLSNIAVLHSPAEELDLPKASFDAACCRFGAMFFADPVRALRAIREAVRPGGLVVLAAWGARERNPFFTLAFDTLQELEVPDPMPPEGHTVFEFAEPGTLKEVVIAAGWNDVREDRPMVRMPLPGVAPHQLLDVLSDISARTANRLAPLDEAARKRVRVRLAERASHYVHEDGLLLPAEVVLVSGRA